MRAIVVNELGDPNVLRIADVPAPDPRPGTLLVRVEAAGVNFMDTRQRRGIGPQMPLPFTPGVEGAGLVEAVGADVTAFAVGDRVGWSQVLGSYAELLVVPADLAVPLPEVITAEQAATVLLQGLTAHMLAATATLAPDGAAVVHAAGGGVGYLLTQLLVRQGRRVVGIVSNASKADIARDSGAEVITSTAGAFAPSALELIGGPAAIVYDGVGATTYADDLEVLMPFGVLAYFGQASGPIPPVDLFGLPKSVFVTKPVIIDHVDTREKRVAYSDELFDLIGSGELQLHVGGRFELGDAAAAHQDMHDRRSPGKLLLLPGA